MSIINSMEDPRLGPSDFVSHRPNLTDEELDTRIAESDAVKALASSEGWRLLLGAMKLKADQCFRVLAVSRDLDKITTAQAYISCYWDLTTNLNAFLLREAGDRQEKVSRARRLRDKVVDYISLRNKEI